MSRRRDGDYLLTEKQQRAWDMHWSGLSYAMIAAKMGVSRSTAQGYVEGARKQKTLAQAHGAPWRRDDYRVRARLDRDRVLF